MSHVSGNPCDLSAAEAPLCNRAMQAMTEDISEADVGEGEGVEEHICMHSSTMFHYHPAVSDTVGMIDGFKPNP